MQDNGPRPPIARQRQRVLYGGRIDFIARTMLFEFHRPVYGGDTIRCTARMVEFEAREDRWKLHIEFDFHNQRDELVLAGHSRGIVRR